MKNRLLFSFLLLSLLSDICLSQEQIYLTDESFALAIAAYTKSEAKALGASDALLLERRDAMNDMEKIFDNCAYFEKEFNDYLSSFREVVVFAAQMYGFYLEIDDIKSSFQQIQKNIKEHPNNVLAVVFSSRKNDIIRNFINRGTDIVTDISDLCFGNMTQADRLRTLYAIRPKLALLSRDMRDMARVIRYTSWMDVWYEVTGEIAPAKTKAEVAQESMEHWAMQVAKMEVSTSGPNDNNQ